MDRNLFTVFLLVLHLRVATREGGVDRNDKWLDGDAEDADVATREGGVDRNISCQSGHGMR